MSGRAPGERADGDPDGSRGEGGRYLYCVVETGDSAGDTVPVSGVDGERPYIVERDGIGVVLHACESPYETGDTDTLKKWLLQHQGVVDEAGRAFGTPLPFRFDTVLHGTDDRVREWIGAEADAIGSAFEILSGNWEYRIEVIWDGDSVEDGVAAESDALEELRARRREASEGKAYLLERQYERRVRELARDRLHEEAETLAEHLREHAAEVRRIDREASLPDDDRTTPDDAYRRSFSVLAPESREEPIGGTLDDLEARPGVEVRFTGPWPPYSFAPELGGEP